MEPMISIELSEVVDFVLMIAITMRSTRWDERTVREPHYPAIVAGPNVTTLGNNGISIQMESGKPRGQILAQLCSQCYFYFSHLRD